MTATRRYFLHCRACKDVRLHEIRTPPHRRHGLLAALSLGLWLPVWLFHVLRTRRPKCRGCGTRRPLSRAVPSVAKSRGRTPVAVPRHLNDAA